MAREAEEPEAVKKLRELAEMFEQLRRAPPPIKLPKKEKESGETR